jgi:hypothetical protein
MLYGVERLDVVGVKVYLWISMLRAESFCCERQGIGRIYVPQRQKIASYMTSQGANPIAIL